MIPRQEVFDTYWKFAAERQNIFFNRLRGNSKPWTNDPILQKYKFCNTYRASDRVSQFLIRNVIFKGNQLEEEVIFRTLLFRMFNKIETWEFLESSFGEISTSNFDIELYGDALLQRRHSGQPIFGNAFILCANKAFGYDQKHLNYLALIRHMVLQDHVPSQVVRAKSLQEIFNLIRSYPLLGNFMAYQMSVDLNYSDAVDFSENDFTVAGPGAERGIKKCFSSTSGKTSDYVIRWMVDNQESEFERLGINFQTLWGRPLHCIDCQGLFCETDKYSRVMFPELTSNRKRIKAGFRPTSGSLDYFYPPKWGLNPAVKHSVKSSDAARASNRQEVQIAFDF